ncbi:MAG: cold shock domain-containing protein, partial [Actinobacteria bacterium]|nr:cold shock domain-containing protein [Actinomycetota bacterium]
KWFSPEKGFGFISVGEGEDIFVHYTSILTDGFRTLKKGQVVEFEIQNGERLREAKNVVILP